MRRAFLLIIAVVSFSALSAQEKWSLRQCIDYAVENNIGIRQTALSVESAEIDLNTTKNSRLPNLSAGMSQNFNFGRMASEIDNSYVNTQASNTSFSLSTSVPVFQGMRINNQVKQNKLDLEAATENLNKAKENLEIEVTGLYLEVLFKKEILAVYREQTALSREQVTKTEEMVATGKVAKAQLYDILSQVASDELNEVSARNDYDFALLNLSQSLNLVWSPAFDIEDPATDDSVFTDNLSSLQSPESIYQTAIDVKPHVREAEYRLQSSEYQVKIAKSSYWPSISLGASFGDGYYYMFGTPNQNKFGEQIRNKHSESVGINMSIPIFNRNQTRNGVRTARVNVRNYELQLQSVKVALHKEIQQAYQRAVAARKRFDATGKSLDAAEESFRAMQISYDNGKATVYEYNETQTKLLSSKSERLQAKYEFLFRVKILDFYCGKEINI